MNLPAAPEPADRGYVAADRDGQGPLLVFTGDVSKDAVRRFQLQVSASQRPGRADLTAATFLSASAIDLLSTWPPGRPALERG